MKLATLKKEYVGKKLLTIIDIKTDSQEVIATLKKMTGNEYSEGIDNAKVLLFEGNKALVFVDFDSDGYRSGDWYLIHLTNVLDKGSTTGIKSINSVVRDIQYYKEGYKLPYDSSDSEAIVITTDEYVVIMGQDHSDSYYPSNFFNVTEHHEPKIFGTDYELVERK